MTAPITNLPTSELQALDNAHHLHPFTHSKTLHDRGVRVIRSARGVHLTDNDGNRILDGMSGLWNVNVGYGRQDIVDAVARQMQELPFYNTFFNTSHPPVIELGRLLAEVTPKQFNRFFSPARARNRTTPSSAWCAISGTWRASRKRASSSPAATAIMAQPWPEHRSAA